MSPDEFASRRGLRRAVEITQPDAELRSWDLEELQALYALQRGDVIKWTATGDVWWFVMRVNGPAKTVTARTVMFEQRRQRVLPFAAIRPIEPLDSYEANNERVSFGLEPRDEPARDLADVPAGSLSPRYADLLRLWPRPRPCHGFANGCDCPNCENAQHKFRWPLAA
jgi:hypothetical protein